MQLIQKEAFSEKLPCFYKDYLDAEFLGRGANSFLYLLALLTLNQPVTSTEDLYQHNQGERHPLDSHQPSLFPPALTLIIFQQAGSLCSAVFLFVPIYFPLIK